MFNTSFWWVNTNTKNRISEVNKHRNVINSTAEEFFHFLRLLASKWAFQIIQLRLRGISFLIKLQCGRKGASITQFEARSEPEGLWLLLTYILQKLFQATKPFSISSQKLGPTTKYSKVEKRKMCAPEFQSHNSESVEWGKPFSGISPHLFSRFLLYIFTFHPRTQPKVTSFRWQENFPLIEIK